MNYLKGTIILVTFFIIIWGTGCEGCYPSSYYYNGTAKVSYKFSWEEINNKIDKIDIGNTIDIKLRWNTVYLNDIKFEYKIFSGNDTRVFNKYDFFAHKIYSNGVYNHDLYINADPTVYLNKNCSKINIRYSVKKYSDQVHLIDRQYIMCED